LTPVEAASAVAPSNIVQPTAQPTSFASGRYQVKRFLGEGGKKKVYLAQDTLLDREVAFALIKTENMDQAARTRITREAQAMGRLGSHPHIVTVFDLGEEAGSQPYMVTELMRGGDVEGLLKKAPDHRLSMDQAIEIATGIARGLEFAHSKGIVHRDVKPGNVWLTQEGIAKIGDFGLALATDRSRLTHSGMMVGTTLYMPPEQAMGGSMGPPADLYSLGATLYEMVTGRPPFAGEDAVSIIGQHINTPPVSPTYYRPDLPQRLETLILQLLEKDPKKRPAYATEVLQSLTKATQSASTETTIPEPVSGPSPLYRRVFVGREGELKQLQAAFDGAISGKGALIMVVGEPGIGKTALCEQVATYATLRGGQTLVGHCYEEGSLSLPYLAFVEAMRTYVLAREPEVLQQEMGTGAADVSRIVSEVRERLRVEPPPPSNPEEDRYRLLQATATFLKNAATIQPLLIVLEDLHDADKGTLEMLTHISRHMEGARILLLGTYRDVAVDRTHPLSATLGELLRMPHFGRITLRGLTADEVGRMVNAITGSEIPWGIAEAVHRQTEGNPLFVQEVVRYLVEEGLLAKQGEKSHSQTPAVMRIPEGLKDVVGKRLTRLSPECNRILQVAAVIGRDFQLRTLQQVSGVEEDALYAALEEATSTAVIEERAGVGGAIQYRFAHAFFRQMLYDEMIAPRRIRLHQQVARALEQQYASRREEHAAELAEHYSYSSSKADLRKAVSYGELAARRAEAVYAYGEAASLYHQALQVQEVLEPNDKAKRFDLLLQLGIVTRLAGEAKHFTEVEGPEALALAEKMGDYSRAARCAFLASMSVHSWGGMEAFISDEYQPWLVALDRFSPPSTLERVYADTLLGLYASYVGDWCRAEALTNRAIVGSSTLGDADAGRFALTMRLNGTRAPQRATERLNIADKLLGRSPPTNPSRVGFVGVLSHPGMRTLLAEVFLTHGQRTKAEQVYKEIQREAEITGRLDFRLAGWAVDCVGALLDGELVQAATIGRRIRSTAKEAGMAGRGRYHARFAEPRAKLLLGYYGGVATEIPDINANRSQIALCWTYEGREAEALDMIKTLVLNRSDFGSLSDETPEAFDAIFLETAVLLKHCQAIEMLVGRLNDSGTRTTGTSLPTCIGRHLGAGCALLGRYDEAREYYHQSLETATKMRFRPEIALTRLQLTELLLDCYPEERSLAIEHLDFAIGEFQEMKMEPALRQALLRKEILRA
jgi:tetratricopeptide (TPR) repeat protein